MVGRNGETRSKIANIGPFEPWRLPTSSTRLRSQPSERGELGCVDISPAELGSRCEDVPWIVTAIGLGMVHGRRYNEGWRGASLLGLPDVGDPFDVAAFRGFRVPEDQDAILLLRQAQAKLSRMPGLPNTVMRAGPVVGWSKSAPELREWVMANRSIVLAGCSRRRREW